jgi:molybdate transport system substrate-binding protein
VQPAFFGPPPNGPRLPATDSVGQAVIIGAPQRRIPVTTGWYLDNFGFGSTGTSMKKKGLIAFSLALSLVGAAAFAQAVNGENVRIYAAAAVKTSLNAIASEYERATGNSVTVVLDSAGATQRNFLRHPEADLLITTPALIEQAQAEGALQDGTSIALGTTLAGVAVPPGSVKPDISSPEKLKAALLAARRIAFSDPSRGATVGKHFMMVIESLGVKDEVLAKATLAPNGIETMRLVLEEGVDIGITQTVEILQANRDALAGPFPDEFELATTYSLWYRSGISPAVAAFVAMLTGPDGRQMLVREGLRAPAAK